MRAERGRRPAGQRGRAGGDRDEDAMTVDERRKYLKRMQGRYWAAERADRGQLLNEMGLVTGLHRRSLVRLLSAHGPGLARQPRRRQRARTYGHQVDDALRVIWESLDYICAPRLTRGGPERAQRTNAVARQIPMRRIAWDEPEPGHFEVDLVHHGGPEPVGEYAYTLQLVDVATGWSERVAVLGRSQRAMEAGFRRVLARLPFAVRELHPDKGSEF